MATYVNDLRLKEIATGDESGTWGTSTNTSLELIGEALGYATQQVFGSDADATTTIADGASDPARAMYFKITSAGSLTATRTCTIAPNTVSRVMFIENATSGSQSIAISQGSGANVTILTGKTAVVYLDGAGSGAAVVDAMAGVDPGVTDTLTEVLVAGNTSGGTNIELSTTDKVQFRDAAIYINSSADGQLDIVADTEIQIAATTVDLNGNLDVSGTALVTGVLTTTAATVHTNGTTMPDNAKAIFGDGNDFEIYFNGTHGVMRTASASVGGNIYIQDDNNIVLGSIGGENYLNAAKDGAVTLYYDNAAKLATTATGIDVTGSVTADGATFSGVASFTDGSSSAPSITNTGDSNTGIYFPADEKIGFTAGGVPTFALDNQGNLLYTSSFQIQSDAQDGQIAIAGGNNSNDGANLGFYGPSHASLANIGKFRADTVETFRFGPTGSVFNEGSADLDFRVESNDNTNMLFVDGTNNRVGIGKAPATHPLEVAGTTTILPSSDGDALIVGKSGGSNLYFYSNASASLITNASGAGAARDGFQITSGNVLTEIDTVAKLSVSAAEVVVNDTGADTDFRVESSGNSSAFMVDGANDIVYINAVGSEAGSRFTVNNDGSGTGHLQFQTAQNDQQNGYVRANMVLARNKDTLIWDPTDETWDYTAGSSADWSMISKTSGSLNFYIGEASGSDWSLSNTAFNAAYLSYYFTPTTGHVWEAPGGGTFVFNEAGNARDFRVESDADAHVFFVDASVDAIVMGNNTQRTTGGFDPKLTVEAGGGTSNTCFFRNNLGYAVAGFQVGSHTSAANYCIFYNGNGSVIGSIQTSNATAGTTVSYNTSSDARLKENIADADDAGELIDAIQVRQFDWIENDEHQKYGMVAQELQTVAPEAVSGDADSEEMMGVDYSKLVPMMLKEIQSLRARINALEAE